MGKNLESGQSAILSRGQVAFVPHCAKLPATQVKSEETIRQHSLWPRLTGNWISVSAKSGTKAHKTDTVAYG
jgi:hypothetical protein